VVTSKEKIQAKLSNRGTACMFAVCTKHHSKDVYRMLNWTTNLIINSFGIIWLNKTYREWKKIKTTTSAVEEETIEFLTGIDKMKSTTNTTKVTEVESNKLEEKGF
jgi:hypothetical protein